MQNGATKSNLINAISANWTEAGQKSSQIQARLEPDIEALQTERRSILKARAKELAQQNDSKIKQGQYLDIVVFTLASERYGFELTYLQETFSLSGLTPLPCTPPFILGLINVRGQIFSVTDLRRFFDLPPAPLTAQSKVIIIRAKEMAFGILADAILNMQAIPADHIQATMPNLNPIQAEYIKGITPDPITILDAAKILTDPRLTVHEEVSS